jgi:hypothetical protein
MMVGLSMQVRVSVCLFSVNLVGEGTIWHTRDEDAHKGKRIILLYFHSELNMGGNDIKMIKEFYQGGMSSLWIFSTYTTN